LADICLVRKNGSAADWTYGSAGDWTNGSAGDWTLGSVVDVLIILLLLDRWFYFWLYQWFCTVSNLPFPPAWLKYW
jgi:hypothetical protein